MRTPQGKLGDLANHVRQGHGRADGSAALGERQQLLREIPGAHDRLFRVAQRFDGLGIHLFVKAREREIAHDDSEEVIEIMGDAAGQQAERLEPAGSQQFGLEPRLAFQLVANLFSLRLDATPERHDPGDEQQDADRQRAGEGENVFVRQPGGAPQYSDVAVFAHLKLKTHRLPVFVVFQLIDSDERQHAAHGRE